MTWGGNPFFKNSLLHVCRLVTTCQWKFQEMGAHAIFVSTTAYLVTSPHVPPSEKHKWVGSGDETNYKPPPDFIWQLCCFCLFFVCLFVLFCFVLFFPQLWDTGSGLATRLASCHPSCAQLYHNVSDILPPVRAALLHYLQISVHNNVYSPSSCKCINLRITGSKRN